MATAVLQHVTNKKLAKLGSLQAKFEQQREQLLNYENKENEPLRYSRHLLHGIKKMDLTHPESSLSNIELFLKQAEHDASVPSTTILQWQNELEKLLYVRSSKYAFSSLFGQLVTEWLDNPNEANRQLSSASEDEDMDFEPVGRKEMYEQRQIWESIVFTERKVDEEALEDFLTQLFGSNKPAVEAAEVTPFDTLRRTLRKFNVKALDTSTLKATIGGVIKSDLFAGEKRDTLLDLKDRESVLAEVVDVLNMSLKPLKDWTWEQAAIPVVQRRQVNGKYRFFMDEEIHQSLLVHYVGSLMSDHVRQALQDFRTKAWEIPRTTAMSDEDVKRRAYYLQETSTNRMGSDVPQLNKPGQSLESLRQREWQDNFFLTQMPKSMLSGARDYNGEDADESTTEKSPVQLKQEMMEMLTADMLLSLETKGEFCVLRSDFTWFGPSLPHATILHLLRFFGFKEHMITFCRTFLKAPLVFAEDGPDATPVNRKSGAPMSHALSDVLGELILFCLDYAVNRATNGANLYRLHDDLWFWGSAESCETAWRVIEKFATVTGLELNEEKTGSAYMTNSNTADPRLFLPSGPIKWGFLILSSTTRKWEVDMTQVNAHITELRLQLTACRSVLSFIQAWNSYVTRFFTTNFGRPSNVHGPSHIRSIISTFEHIQTSLFPSGSVTSHLKTMISTRFSIPATSIPTGFLYFPTELGGLDLRNPFIPLLSRLHDRPSPSDPDDVDVDLKTSYDRDDAALEPSQRLRIALLRDRNEYDIAHARFVRDDNGAKYASFAEGWRPVEPRVFFGFEDYMRFRGETSWHLQRAEEELRRQPVEKGVQGRELEERVVRAVTGRMGEKWWARGENRWVVALYRGEMEGVFGGVEVGERELLPVGLVRLLRGERVRWRG
ncbi:hypothetical protein C1H76_7629 [Elsinoe australis]|uniref:Reverse transcriptase domain-containing protein n=1 Tax=Elsinoe australis TaxID=40998 RepID=A0A4U7AQF6_9PEZI|nr:hypothetical protein C1H76_7629 [Elsinoe australis]